MNRVLALCAVTLLVAACNQATPPPQPAATAQPTTATAKATSEYKVVNWAQQETDAGKPFNVQPDGNSGLTFELNQPAPAGEIRATFDGKPLTGLAANGVVVTATIPAEYLAKPGRYPIELLIPTATAPVRAGEFVVK